MTINSKNYLTMVDRSQMVLNDYKTIWTNRAKMAARIARIVGLETDIEVLAKHQGLSTGGATKTKKTDREVAGDQSFHVENILKSYYLEEDDETNFDIVDFCMTDYVSGDIKESIKKMKLIYDTAAAIIKKTPTALDEFNLAATDMDDLKTAIDVLSDVSGLPMKMRSDNKAITKQINEKFAALRAEMTGLDVNVNTFTKTQSAFSDAYFAGRRIVNSGVGHKTAEVALMPVQSEAVLGDEYTVGDKLTIRNHCAFSVEYGLTHDPNVVPTVMKSLAGMNDVQVTVELDSTGSFGHWLMLRNPHDMDDVNVTVLVAKG